MLRVVSSDRASRLVMVVLALSCLMGRAALATDSRPAYGGVVDFAKVFGAEERRSLEIVTGRIARHMNVDFFVASVDDRARHWSWRFETNRAMVDRVFGEVKNGSARHFQGTKDLVVLLVFKTQPVLHLKTDDKALERTLLFNNFYSGAKGAYQRVRDPRRESHSDAAMRYLEAFATTVASNGVPTRVQEAGYWLFEEFALVASRDVVERPLLEPLLERFWAAVDWLWRTLGYPGWVSFLVVFAIVHLTIAVTAELVPRAAAVLGDPLAAYFGGEALGWLCDAAWLILMVPLLMVLFSIVHGDLENLVYLSQTVPAPGRFSGTGKAEIVTFLEWSEAIGDVMPDIPWFGLLVAVAVVVGLEYLSFRRSGGVALASARAIDWVARSWALTLLTHLVYLFTLIRKLAKGGVFVLSLIVLPGLVQLYFIVSAVAIRAAFLLLSGNRATARVRTPSRLASHHSG